MIVSSLFALVTLLNINPFLSECPNACSAHGRCGSYDMCRCYRNFMADDCSQRVCPFGLAHVDTPKGDLNMDGVISSPDMKVVRNDIVYPYGTTEQYPDMIDSDGNILTNSAHEYRECSNKGVCDRQSGVCMCYDGYSGSSCSRLSCPAANGLECNGRGICESAKRIAQLDDGNEYSLWDSDMSFGCVCDAGFYGPSCEKKRCKAYYDPIYYDTESSVRYANWSYVLYTQNQNAEIIGNYSLVFHDLTGQKWRTDPIDYTARCSTIVQALEALPNGVIRSSTVRCLQWLDYHSISSQDEPILLNPNPYYGRKTTLVFPENPGKLADLEVDMFLDGKRPTLQISGTSSAPGAVKAFVYSDGFIGEDTEYFTEKCYSVDVTLVAGVGYHYLSGLTPIESRVLARCLGDSDGSLDTYSAQGRVLGQNYSWDYGNTQNPHVIRLVDLTQNPRTDLCNGSADSLRNGGNRSFSSQCLYGNGLSESRRRPPGFFVPLFFDPQDGLFKLFTRPAVDYSALTVFSVFTTRATAQLVSDQVRVVTDGANLYSDTVFTVNSTKSYAGFTGNVDCETNPSQGYGAFGCVEKGDTVFFIDPSLTAASAATNPKYMNLYTVTRIYTSPMDKLHRIQLSHAITSAWGASSQARVYQLLTTDLAGGTGQQIGYTYVSECSNRGLCSEATGTCSCFTGYTAAACSFEYNLIS